MGDLLKTLYLIRSLGSGPLSSSDLQQGLGVSRPTVNRYLAEARHLGADIEAVQGNRSWLYELRNWPMCEKTVCAWIVLEESKNRPGVLVG